MFVNRCGSIPDFAVQCQDEFFGKARKTPENPLFLLYYTHFFYSLHPPLSRQRAARLPKEPPDPSKSRPTAVGVNTKTFWYAHSDCRRTALGRRLNIGQGLRLPGELAEQPKVGEHRESGKGE